MLRDFVRWSLVGALVTSSVASCRADKAENVLADYRLNRLDATSLLHHIDEPALTICLDARQEVDQKIMERYAQWTQKAVEAWLEPLREFAPESILVEDVEVSRCKKDPDGPSPHMIVIVDDRAGRGPHYGIDEGYVLVTSDQPFFTFLHEFGHAFGLSDTYYVHEGDCRLGYPRSVMCGDETRLSVLRPSDRTAAIGSLCRVGIAGLERKCRDHPKPGPTPARASGDPEALLGITVENYTNRALEGSKPGTKNFIIAKGAKVVAIRPDGPLANSDWLKPGMVIYAVQEKDIRSTDDLEWALRHAHTESLMVQAFSHTERRVFWHDGHVNLDVSR